MIVIWALSAASGIWRWMLGLVPASAADPIVQVAPSVNDIITPFATGVQDLGVWIPWGTLTVALAGTFVLYSATFVLRLLRYIYGLVPFVNSGGS